MTVPTHLPADALYHRCDPERFDFDTTDAIDDPCAIIGQTRALQSLHFGVAMEPVGYNLYVMGPPGMGKHSTVREYLQEKARERPTPPDWAYINDFDQPSRPRALRLPAGWGERLRQEMEHLLEELAAAIPAAFEGSEYRSHVQSIEDELKERQEQVFTRLGDEAQRHHIKLFRTPNGFAFAPLKDDEVVTPEDFQRWPEQEQRRVEEVVANLQEQLQKTIEQIPLWRKETRERILALNREVALSAVGHLIQEMEQHYAELPAVITYLEQVQKDVVENVKDFLQKGEDSEGQGHTAPTDLHRYKINVVVDHRKTEGAPVVYLDHPTYLNLVGRVDHIAQYGTLVTDFTLIRPGALHRAAGGYLIVDAHKLLTQPYAWEGLKRALYANEIRIESLEKMLSLMSTVSLEPEPIPLDLKVIVLGDRELYYLLYEYDPDFAELFKVAADFEGHIDRSHDNAGHYAQLIAGVARKERLRPFDRAAVARVVEHGSRLVEDADKLTTHLRSIADLLREADHWAKTERSRVVGARHVQQAIDHQIYRASRIRDHLQEEIRRNILFIDTAGARVGQINGLSVLSLGDFAFGQPSRITATVGLGEGSVVDIEREVELGGPLHSKGVLILSAFLAARYAQKQPLSLAAHLVFEQNYGQVDGDSASLAELCALLSAIGGLPIRQGFAVTGSVNQLGQVQPIGGVNEKIEGFFDICRARGLDGEQGVLIPAANVRHLMLKEEVVRAAAEGRFRVIPVARVDEAIAVLTGTPAGEADAQGNWPADSVNGRVMARLCEMTQLRQSFAEHGRDRHDDDPGEGEE